MTDPLGKDARALLDAARGGDDPSAADRARVREKVMTAVGAGAAAGVGAGAGSAKLGKVLAAVLGAGAVVAAVVWYVAVREPEPRRSTTTTTTSTSTSTTVEAEEVEADVPAVVEEDVDGEVEEIEMEPVKVPKKKEDTLAAERALLEKANAALKGGDAEGALSAVATHQKTFPKGHLVEEIAATKVRALCAAGRTEEGEAAKEKFLTKWPRSVHAPRVQAACR